MNPSNQGGGNAGSSINFDAVALQEAEEAEYHREEQEQQNEVGWMSKKVYLLLKLKNRICKIYFVQGSFYLGEIPMIPPIFFCN